jgi:hypothetical protein
MKCGVRRLGKENRGRMGHVSHGLAKLGAGASRMAKKGEGKAEPKSRTLSVRLPIEEADRVEAKAAAAGMSAGAYIARKLRGAELDSRPDIAAIACLMRIASAAATRNSQSSAASIDGAAAFVEPVLTDAQVQRMIDALCGSVAAHIGTHDIPPLEEPDHGAGVP